MKSRSLPEGRSEERISVCYMGLIFGMLLSQLACLFAFRLQRVGKSVTDGVVNDGRIEGKRRGGECAKVMALFTVAALR